VKLTTLRTVVAAAGTTLAGVAQAQSADGGGISTSGWMSMGVVVVICVGLYWVYKKTT